MKRHLAHAVYQYGSVCFACGRRGAQPCPGHEYGGTTTQARARRWAPLWLLALVNSRWGLR